MATVIDELILRLSLDPSELDEGEQRAIATLRRMERAATRGGQEVTDAVGRSTIGLFRAIENPIGAVRRQLEAMVLQVERPRQELRTLAEQGTQTGETIERGLSRGTVAVRALGVAGLAAFAAYETLSKTLSAVGGVAGRVFGAGLGAGAAGMGITQFGAISQALFSLGNVPQEQTQGWLAQYAIAQRQAQFGQEPGRSAMVQLNTALAGAAAAAGIQGFGIDPYRDTAQQYAEKLARGFAQAPTEAMAQAAGNELGLDLQQVRALRRAGQQPGGLEAAAAAQEALAPTRQQQAAAERLIKAQNDLANAWESLYRSIMLSGLADALTTFANWLNRLVTTPSSALDTTPEPGLLEWMWHGGSLKDFFSGRSGGNLTGGPTRSLTDVISSGESNQLVDYIIKHEGSSPAGVVNNPGNIKFHGLPGQIDSGVQATDGGTFASYSTPEEGRAAIGSQISRAASGLSTAYGPNPTLGSFLSTYSNRGYNGSDISLTPPQPAPQQQPTKTSYLPSAATTVQLASAQSGPVTTTHNYGDVNLNGDIVVNAPSREGAQIAGSVADQVRQLTPMTTPANTGLA